MATMASRARAVVTLPTDTQILISESSTHPST
jgi:hypothetical protein